MDEDDNQKEEEQNQEETEDTDDLDAEIFKGIKEIKVPLLRSLSEDKAVGRLVPWTLKLTSQLMPESAILIVHSNIWPGAYTYYDGKSFDRLYIGFGYKYSTYHYAPVMPLTQQNEFSESLVEPDDMEEKQKNEAEKEKTLDKNNDEGIREMIEELMEMIEDDESEKDKVNEETGDEERSNELPGPVESEDMEEKQKDEAENKPTLDKSNDEGMREMIEELMERIEDDESEKDKENEENGDEERSNNNTHP